MHRVMNKYKLYVFIVHNILKNRAKEGIAERPKVQDKSTLNDFKSLAINL